jgi:uncharacterized membrane protein YidH (DUF202 family)
MESRNLFRSRTVIPWCRSADAFITRGVWLECGNSFSGSFVNDRQARSRHSDPDMIFHAGAGRISWARRLHRTAQVKMRYLVAAVVIYVGAVVAAVGTHPWGTTGREMQGPTAPSDVGRAK